MDTSSLLAYAQFYLPFASVGVKNSINGYIQNENWILLDRAYHEFRNIRRGVFFQSLEQDYPEKKLPMLKIGEPLYGGIAKFLKRLNGEFAVTDLQKRLTPAQFEQEKADWLNDTDAQLILYALNQSEQGIPVTIVTEETAFQNDGKVIRKIPYICERVGINCMNLVTFLQQNNLLRINTIDE